MTNAIRDTPSDSINAALGAPQRSSAGPRPVVTGAPGVFLGCAAAVLLHVADDNFLQPADGMSAGDHLLSGAVPLLAIAAAMFAYPRVRAGAQAIIALVMALTGLVVGFVEAGNHLFTVGLSGDDFTGLVARCSGAGAGRTGRAHPVEVTATRTDPHASVRAPDGAGRARPRRPDGARRCRSRSATS